MKNRRIISLRAKFAALFFLFAVVIMCSVSIVTYRSYRNAMMERYAKEAVTIAKLAASYLDGDEMVRYSITRKKMRNMRGWQRYWTISKRNPEYYICTW